MSALRSLDPPKTRQAEGERNRQAVGQFPVVGIGAFGGGLEAVARLLENLPRDTGSAFVIVQHLDPEAEAVQPERLAAHTSMAVRQVARRTEIERDHVYVIPPHSRISMRGGVLQSARREDRSVRMPIDFFFRSLAASRKKLAAGVILSGDNRDGALGLKAIKSRGGVTFAQDGSAGVADFVLPPEGIARELARIASRPDVPASEDPEAAGLACCRDPEALDALVAKAFPAIVEGKKPGEAIRIWVPGCSSGEDVYAIAIRLREYLEAAKQSFSFRLFGSDTSPRAIAQARAGKFPERIARTIAPQRLEQAFIRDSGGDYRISKAIRELCVFSKHDPLHDFPFLRIDLIVCRNGSVPPGSAPAWRMLLAFARALEPKGCLLLGGSDGLGPLAGLFAPLDGEHRLYERNARPAEREFAAPPQAEPARAAWLSSKLLSILDRQADRLLLTEYAPSGLVLNENGQVLGLRGEVEPYIVGPPAGAAPEALSLVREEIAPFLRAALRTAKSANRAIRRRGIKLSRNGRLETIDLVVRPIAAALPDRHFLVLFEDRSRRRRREPSAVAERAPESTDSWSHLPSSVAQFRRQDEEARSANEELRRLNQELAAAKAELQTVNHELETANIRMNRRNAELLEANDDLMNLLDSMQSSAVILDNELRLCRFTRLAAKAFHLAQADLGRPVADLNLGIDVANLAQLAGEVIRTHQASEREAKSLENRWYSLRMYPYRAGDNRIEGVVIKLMDIDGLKRAFEKVVQARDYAQTILATVREPLVVLDRSLCIQAANSAFFECFPIRPEDALRRVIFEIDRDQWDSPKLRRLLEEVSDADGGEVRDLEIEADLDRTGEKVFHIRANRVKEPGGDGLIVLMLEDVTNPRMAVEAKYRRLFETAKDGILIVDRDTGRIIDVNPLVTELFGYSRGEILGGKFTDVEPVRQMNDVELALEKLPEEEIVRFPEAVFQTKDGRRIETEVIGNLYRAGGRRIAQFNIRDITERKNFDRRLQQTAKLESLGLLAGGIAHDFNNLLTGIMGNASLALEDAPAESSYHNSLREVLKAAHRAADLTRQMLAYAGKGRFLVRPLNLSDLASDLSTLIRSAIPKSVDLELSLDPDIPPVAADATQMQQLIMNLAINGAEAIEDGEAGCVHLKTSEKRIGAESGSWRLAAGDLAPGPHVLLEVTDTGAGMDEEMQARIFEPFFTTKFTGRGLGLAAVLGIVKGHHGAIRIESAPGKGTIFQVFFPVESIRQVRARRRGAPRDLRGKGTILLVDDEEMVLSLAKPALQRYGYHVLTAANGEIAVQIMKHRGDEMALAILDLTMPVMGGREAVARIKALQPQLPVILSSGYDEAEAARQFGEHDLAGFLQKPYTVEKILEAVKAVLA